MRQSGVAAKQLQMAAVGTARAGASSGSRGGAAGGRRVGIAGCRDEGDLEVRQATADMRGGCVDHSTDHQHQGRGSSSLPFLFTNSHPKRHGMIHLAAILPRATKPDLVFWGYPFTPLQPPDSFCAR